MTDIAIIGGSGLATLKNLAIIRREVIATPFGEPSGPLTHGRLCGRDIVFLARHGQGHTIVPHKVNYRANLWALNSVGIHRVLAVASVGGIRTDMTPGRIVFPDQIIDYTYERQHTFFDRDNAQVTHIDFTRPYAVELRAELIAAAKKAKLDAVHEGVYAAMQGPRLETLAEINRLERDGCHMVGMTGMPETALARELGLSYSCCAVVANWAAGRGNGQDIHDQINANLQKGMNQVRRLLEAFLSD